MNILKIAALAVVAVLAGSCCPNTKPAPTQPAYVAPAK